MRVAFQVITRERGIRSRGIGAGLLTGVKIDYTAGDALIVP